MIFCQLMEFVVLFERDVAHNFNSSLCIPHFRYGNKKKMRLKMTIVASSKDHKHRLLDSYSI